MQELVAAGLADGALGLSTGLDYVPGLFAGTEEITALCRPLAPVDGLYVTHMRGGYEDNAAAGLDEVVAICRDAGVRGHVSHLHARSALVRELVDRARTQVDLTFDSYPYSRGSSLLSMLLLPPTLLAEGVGACAAALADPAVRAEVLDAWVPVLAARADMGPRWAEQVRYAHVAAPGYEELPGLTLAEAGERAGTSAAELGLPGARRVRPRGGGGDADPRRARRRRAGPGLHPPGARRRLGRHLPRRRAAPARLRHLRPLPAGVRRRARRPRLGRRRPPPQRAAGGALRAGGSRLAAAGGGGRRRPGGPRRRASRATYDEPRALAQGVDDVWVAGVRVLADGALTGALAGRGLRRGVR